MSVMVDVAEFSILVDVMDVMVDLTEFGILWDQVVVCDSYREIKYPGGSNTNSDTVKVSILGNLTGIMIDIAKFCILVDLMGVMVDIAEFGISVDFMGVVVDIAEFGILVDLMGVMVGIEEVSAGSSSRGGNVTVYVFDINHLSLPTPFNLILCLFLSLWPFQLYFILDSPENSSLSHSVLLVLFLLFGPFNYISPYKKSPSALSPDVILCG